MKAIIDSQFDGGNIDVINADGPHIALNIRKDIKADYSQWFYFRAQLTKGEIYQFTINNAADVSYPEAWQDCSFVASYDRQEWFRIYPSYENGELQFPMTAEQAIVYFALYPPYSYERHNDLIAWALQQENCELYNSTKTVEQRPIELLKISNNSNSPKKNYWIIARQHPAETMAEWFMEGLLQTLLDPHNATSRNLLKQIDFYIVANMNPDGSVAGNLRTNGAGVDLNRSWLTPNSQTSPESAFVLQEMDKLGVDLFLDIHGDEEIPFVFAAGCEGNPSYSDELDKADKQFRQVLHRINPDFSCENGYQADKPGEADLSIACNQVGERFNCLSLTLEMPFKDNQYLPDQRYGWSTSRCKLLAQSVLTALHQAGIKP